MPTLTLTSIYPYRYNEDIPLNANLELGFSEPVAAGSGEILIDRDQQPPLAIDIRSANVRFEGSKVVVDPPVDFVYGQAYTIRIPAGVIKAVNGDAVNGEESTSFRAIRTPEPQRVTGTAGADTIAGGNGNDVLDGADGSDDIKGWDGNDMLSGGSGDDTLDGGNGDDVLDGGDGNDIVSDGAGRNTLRGGAGNDTMGLGGGGNSMADGGDGDDTINSGLGATLEGGSGNDRLTLASWEESGAASLNGGAGDDVLGINQTRGQVTTALSGGAGRDLFVFNIWGAGPVAGMHTITDYEPGTDRLDFPGVLWAHPNGNPFGAGYLRAEQQGLDTVISIDNDGPEGNSMTLTPFVTLKNTALTALGRTDFAGLLTPDGSNAGLQLQGSAGNDTLAGSQMADILNGAGGVDSLEGNGGDDLLDGGDGDDGVSGGNGNDTLHGGSGSDWVSGGAGDDTLDGGDDNDHLLDTEGSNTVHGGAGHDGIRVNGAVNRVFGGAGVDFITIEGGTATVDGGDGDDRIEVLGPRADVTAIGGGGRDRYAFDSKPGQAVTITDFATGKDGDILDPFTLFAPENRPTVNLFLSGQLRLQQNGADTLLQFNRHGPMGEFQTVAKLLNIKVEALTHDNFAQGIHPSGATLGETLTGGGGPDTLSGGFQDDTIDGGGGDDTLYGGAGNDTLRGGAGNDRLQDGAGKNSLDGGDGIDHAGFGGLANYRVTRNGATTLVENRTTGAVDTLANVERLEFHDLWNGTITMALDVAGNAGKVYRLYQAAYDRKPDDTGFSFWLNNVDRGQGMAEVARYFMASDEFRKLYGAAPTNAEFVTRLYHNVLHREPEPGGYTFWLEALDSKRATQLDLLNTFAESPENVANVASLIGDGIWYTTNTIYYPA